MGPCRRLLRNSRRYEQTGRSAAWTRSSSRELLRGALERHDWEVSPPGLVTDGEIEADSRLPANEGLRNSARGSPGPFPTGFESRGAASRPPTLEDLVGGRAAEPGVRSVAVVPREVKRQLVLQCGEAVQDQDQTPRALGLDGSDAALDHRQAPVLSHGSEPVLDAAAATPPPESLREELSALVGDEVLWLLANAPENSFQDPANRRRGRLPTKDREAHHAPREVVDGKYKPPAEGPDLRQREGEPGGPEAERSGNGREINVPKVIRPPSGDAARARLTRWLRLGPSRVPLHPANGRRPEVEARPGQDLGAFHFSESRAEDLEALHEVSDKVRKLVHRFGQTDERIRPFLVETAHPRRDREWSQQEDPSGLGERPAADGAKLEDRESRGRRIVGAFVGVELLHAGILDSDLFAQELDLLP